MEFFRKKSSKTVIIAYEYQYSLFFSKIPLNEQKEYKGREYDSLRLTLGDIFNTLPAPQIKSGVHLSDLQTVKSDFLIDNIEEAIKIWEANEYDYRKDFDLQGIFPLNFRKRWHGLAFCEV